MERGGVGGSPLAEADGGFAGFPASGRATALPNLFFSRLLPEIENVEELLVTLYFIFAQGLTSQASQRRSPPFVTRRELAADGTLARALANLCENGGEALARGLALAVERGSLLRVEAKGEGGGPDGGGLPEELYLLATPGNRRAAERLAGAEMRLAEPLPPAATGDPGYAVGRSAEPLNIFALYEGNIGAITPLMADDLKDAEERYPPQWVEDAFREAVSLNKRSWRYIHAILKRWEAEGRDYEEAGRDAETDWLERYERGKRRLRRGR